MKLSSAGLKLIKNLEGYHEKLPNGDCRAYRCQSGVWTIGYGMTHGIEPEMIWTHEQAEKALLNEIAKLEEGVTHLVQVPITQNMFDALVSFSYNCGLKALSESTVLRRTNVQDYKGAAEAFGMWVKGGGRVLPVLVKRRALEAKLYLTPPEDPAYPLASVIQEKRKN